MKQVTGYCFNISIYCTATDAELLSVMVKDKDMRFWKFNLGEWKKITASGKQMLQNYNDIIQLLKQNITIEVDENALGKIIFTTLINLQIQLDATITPGSSSKKLKLLNEFINKSYYLKISLVINSHGFVINCTDYKNKIGSNSMFEFKFK